MATVLGQRAPVTRGTAAWHAVPGFDVARALDVDVARGLSSPEAANRLADVGPNRLEVGQAEPALSAFARQFREPVCGLLVCAGLAGLALGDVGTGLAAIAAAVVGAVLWLAQEGPGGVPTPALPAAARVRRDGLLRRISGGALVPGDVVLIRAGDEVPADGRLVDSATLRVDERALGGESIPVAKGVEVVDDADVPLAERTDMVYAGTRVVSGTGELVVTGTGTASELGRVAAVLARDRTPLAAGLGLSRVPAWLPLAGGACLLASLGVQLARGHGARSLAAVAVAFVVAALPAGRPAVVAVILARASGALARLGAILRRPAAAPALGATSTLVVDASGTLTHGRASAVELVLPGGNYTIAPGGLRRVLGEPEVPLAPFLAPFALAAEGDAEGCALMALVELGGFDVAASRAHRPPVARLRRDGGMKLTASFHRTIDDAGADVVRCFALGSPEQLLGRARTIVAPDMSIVRLDADARRDYMKGVARLAAAGARVVASARRDVDPQTFDPAGELLPLVDGLTLLGVVGVLDAPRADAKAAVAAARAAAIRLVMVTGESVTSAAATARRLGLNGQVVSGEEVLAGVPLTGVAAVARATPAQRAAVVETLRASGAVVAMAGRGIADAAALRAADAAIAVEPPASAVARAAASVTVTADGPAAVLGAMSRCREIPARLAGCARFQLGASAALAVAFVGAGVLGRADGMPLLPLQALYLSLTVMVAQAVGVSHLGTVDVRRRAGWLATVALVQAATTLIVLALAEPRHGTATARTMALVAFALMNVVWSLAGERSLFRLDTFADRATLAGTTASLFAVVMAAQSALVGRLVGTVALDLGQWLLCAGSTLPLIVACEGRARLRSRARRRSGSPLPAA